MKYVLLFIIQSTCSLYILEGIISNVCHLQFAATSSAREQEKYGLAGAVAEEALSNIKTVNAFCGQAVEIARYYSIVIISDF